MNKKQAAVITGLGVEIPGLTGLGNLWAALEGRLDSHCAFEPEAKLGRKGLRYKDRATKLALCAVHDALEDAGLPLTLSDRKTGVVVSSNFGNLDTVCRVAATIHEGGSRSASPLDLPNASSNAIASSIAIRHGCRGVNLTVCNGATGGLDAIYMAASAIRAGRAARVLVVGVEPLHEVAVRLAETANDGAAPGDFRLGEGAACVVLEAADEARTRGGRVYAEVGAYQWWPNGGEPDGRLLAAIEWAAPEGLWIRSAAMHATSRALVDRVQSGVTKPPEQADIGAFGELYGAAGVVQAVAAALRLSDGSQHERDGTQAVLTAGGYWGDGLALVELRGGRSR
jgi:3-oxoacyl-[acyl-carrier-protein] synthase II